MHSIFASLLLSQGLLVDTTALAAVALIGYLFGRRTSRAPAPPTDVTLLIELARAQCVAKDLEHLTQHLRTEVNSHLASLAAFQSHIELMQKDVTSADWRQLRDRADALLEPTMALAESLSLTCDQLRRQQGQLTSFAETRIDRETNTLNRRAMLERLHACLPTHVKAKRRLALVICSVDVDFDADETGRTDRLQSLARLIEQYARTNDVVARYGPQEFVVLMPRTELEGAVMLSKRILKVVDASLERRAWGGVVEAEAEETPEELLARAESALRGAMQEKDASLYVHDGVVARRHEFEVQPTADRTAAGRELATTCSNE